MLKTTKGNFMKKKEQFKRLLKFFAAFVIIAVFAFSFFQLWCQRYNEDMKERFYYYGNVLMVVVYVIVYAFSANSFSAFRIGYYKVLSLFLFSHGSTPTFIRPDECS